MLRWWVIRSQKSLQIKSYGKKLRLIVVFWTRLGLPRRADHHAVRSMRRHRCLRTHVHWTLCPSVEVWRPSTTSMEGRNVSGWHRRTEQCSSDSLDTSRRRLSARRSSFNWTWQSKEQWTGSPWVT